MNQVWAERYEKLQEQMKNEIKCRDRIISQLQGQIDSKANNMEQRDQVLHKLTLDPQ